MLCKVLILCGAAVDPDTEMWVGVPCFSSLCCKAAWALWWRCQPALQPPEDEGCCCFSKWRKWQAWGGINPLRAQGEIMREIWLFWWSYATGSNTAHAVRSCSGLLFISFYTLIHNCALSARGSVTDGKSSLPLCWLKKHVRGINVRQN